ncbi:putative transcription repressor PLATZ family [Arabidopsis thaliana]
MVSSIVKMENDDVMTPPWLTPMLRADYFVTCSIHTKSSKSECNLFCLDCSGNAFCSYFLAHHRTHRVIQIRRSSYHNVVRVSEIQKHIDISCIQTYVINSAKIFFLNARPQCRTGKSLNKTCQICSRNLLDSFLFCSLACKLEGVKNGEDPNLTLFHSGKSDDSSKIINTGICSRLIDGISIAVDDQRSETAGVLSPETPSIESHRNYPMKSRRKGIPQRAPF